MIQLLGHAVIWGCCGLLVECFFTGINSVITGNNKATSTTYLWMFPIYSSAGFAFELIKLHLHPPALVAVLLYTPLSYIFEFAYGWLLFKLLGECPWKYKDTRWSVLGLVRLDYWPLWAALALAWHYFNPWLLNAIHLPI